MVQHGILLGNISNGKKIKRNNFEGGFVVTGKGDNAVLTPKTVKPKTKPKFTRPKKEKEPEEQPKGIFTHPDGWYWYKNTPLGRLVTHIKVGKVKYNVLDKLGQGKDGITYYCNHAEMGKTIIKFLHPYGRKYWHRYETIRHRIQAGDLKNESIIKQLFQQCLQRPHFCFLMLGLLFVKDLNYVVLRLPYLHLVCHW